MGTVIFPEEYMGKMITLCQVSETGRRTDNRQTDRQTDRTDRQRSRQKNIILSVLKNTWKEEPDFVR